MALLPSTLCGYDADSLLSYKTPKVVRVLDARLGALKYSFTLLILLYVLGEYERSGDVGMWGCGDQGTHRTLASI